MHHPRPDPQHLLAPVFPFFPPSLLTLHLSRHPPHTLHVPSQQVCLSFMASHYILHIYHITLMTSHLVRLSVAPLIPSHQVRLSIAPLIPSHQVRVSFMDQHGIAFVTHGDDMPKMTTG